MRPSKCLFNSATALRNVFISNSAVAWETPGQLQRLLLPAVTVPIQPTILPSGSRRHFSSHQVSQYRYNRKVPESEDDAPKPAQDRAMRDYEIVYPWIQLRKDDGSLTEPQRTSAVLKKMDVVKNTLILLAKPRLDSFSKGPEYPICRIGDRKAEKAVDAEKKALLKKTPKIVSKVMELNWAIAPHDLRTRMTQLKKFLAKGYQVELTMMNARKRGKRRAEGDEAKEVLQAVETAIAEVPGAKETKPRDGKLGETLILLLHAPTGGAASKKAEAGASETRTEASTEAPAANNAPAEQLAVNGG